MLIVSRIDVINFINLRLCYELFSSVTDICDRNVAGMTKAIRNFFGDGSCEGELVMVYFVGFAQQVNFSCGLKCHCIIISSIVLSAFS